MRQIHNDTVCYVSKLRGQVFSVAQARLDVMQPVQFDIVLQAAKGIGILLKSNPLGDFLGQQYRKRPNAGKTCPLQFRLIALTRLCDAVL